MFKEDLESEYEVEEIIAKRFNKSKKIYEYKIKWAGYSMNQCTWEPLENLNNVLIMVQEYDANNYKQTKSSNFSNNSKLFN